MAELLNPNVDFSSLGQLGNVYREAQDKQGLKAAFAGGIGSDPQSLAALAQRVAPHNPQLGINLAQLAHTYTRQGTQDARQQGLDTFNQNMERERLGLARNADARAATKANEGPRDKANERVQMLVDRNIDPSTPESQAFILSGEWAGPGTNGASLNPVYGTVGGKPAMVQTTKSGRAIQTQLPEGFEIAKDPIKVDSGTHFTLVDPQTRQPVGTLPKDVAGVEREKVLGEDAGKSISNLPQIMSTASETLKAIEGVRNHAGRGWGTGTLGTIPGIPGTSQRGFIAAVDQLKGKTFLEAYNSLRGAGAIANAEGERATNAIARLDRAQNKEDFETGLNDLRDVIKSGMLRAAAKSRAPGAAQSSPASAAPAVVSFTDYFRQ